MVMRLSEKEQKEIYFSSNQQQQMQRFVLMKLVSGSANLLAAGLGYQKLLLKSENNSGCGFY
jgi:hypothetical protein